MFVALLMQMSSMLVCKILFVPPATPHFISIDVVVIANQLLMNQNYFHLGDSPDNIAPPNQKQHHDRITWVNEYLSVC